jgi:gamma-glutamyltranspeptidase/glutathione hydrolase
LIAFVAFLFSKRSRLLNMLIDNFSHSQTTRKAVVSTRGGIVSAQHRRAAEVGAAILQAGGDAVDAAIATSFAIGVV